MIFFFELNEVEEVLTCIMIWDSWSEEETLKRKSCVLRSKVTEEKRERERDCVTRQRM